MALRDTDMNGKADIIERFGDYPNDGKFGTGMKINEGYLYYSSELVIYRQKLNENKLIPDGKPEVVIVDPYPMNGITPNRTFDEDNNIYVPFSAPVCEDYTKPNTSLQRCKGEFYVNNLTFRWNMETIKTN